MSVELKKEDVANYVLAGNATVTVESGKTGKYFTFKVIRSKEVDVLYFIHLLTGPDNEDDYQFIGSYDDDRRKFTPMHPWTDYFKQGWPPSVRAANFLFEKLYNKPDLLHVYHEGRCGKCGRKLTTPESIARGLGPECAKY